MNILILSQWGGGTALGWRLTKEGHRVIMWIKNKDYKTVGDGFIKKTPEWESLAPKSDLIIIDDSGLGKISEELKNKGYPVWGGTHWSDEIENDRGLGQKTLKDVGMTTIPSNEFTDLNKGIEFVKAHPGRYVVKPSGPIQDEKALSYCGKDEDGQDMISMLEHYKAKWAAKITKFELQEFKKGIEVAISAFFNGKEFVEPIEISCEHKKLMPGNSGPSTGEMGTSMIWMNKNKIYKESIGRMAGLLQKNKYTGYIDINCISEEKTLWPLEFTTRFGYPTIQLKMETIKGNMGEWMKKIVSGENATFKVSNPYSICVVMATPPYPFSSKDIYKKYSEDQEIIFGMKDRTGVWPGEVQRDKDNKWYLTGESGFSVIVTGQGKSIKESQDMAYKRVDAIIIPNEMHRIDIGDKTQENLKKLNSWGWFS